jgi:bifunctional enzyme CysN/CysC
VIAPERRAALSQVSVVAVGHVDHGKSTLIGRLLNDTGNLPQARLDEMRRASERRGVDFEWSFVLDALQGERDQAVTIDTTRIWLRLEDRDVVLIDAPGHKEFLRNMVTGASDADAALLVVDAFDGISEQTRRHALLLELIGIRAVVVAVNKMDRVGYSQARFDEIQAEMRAILTRIGIEASAFVPICARHGDNVATVSAAMPWYDGPTIIEGLLAVPERTSREGGALRIAVQGVLRRDLTRIVVGRIESGSFGVGDEICISPGNRIARIRSIESWPPGDATRADAGAAAAFTLDGPVFIDRGDIVSDVRHRPVPATEIRARLLWLGARDLRTGQRLGLRFGTRAVQVEAAAIERVISIESLDGGSVEAVRANDVAEVVFKSRETLAVDDVAIHPGLARFVLTDGPVIVGGGTILAALDGLPVSGSLVPAAHLLDAQSRAWRNGHRGAVVWLTGLPAAGKSTLAMQLERRLFERGYSAYVLDGDNVRAGLCSDLGFSPDDRRENVRRVGEVAALFADAGTIAIAAFISPYRRDRERARRAAGAAFHEIYVRADAVVCEARDPKGHYRQARAGELADFTGVTGEYEAPLDPELIIDTSHLSIADATEALLRYVEEIVSLSKAGSP